MKFVVQRHVARNLHYDLRLEADGVLKSWAVPKEPPVKAGVKRLAIAVADHDLGYANFSGEIKEGYGKGTVKIWDKGSYKTEEKNKGRWVFSLKGKKLEGTYVLLRFKKAGDKNWLFFKKDKIIK